MNEFSKQDQSIRIVIQSLRSYIQKSVWSEEIIASTSILEKMLQFSKNQTEFMLLPNFVTQEEITHIRTSLCKYRADCHIDEMRLLEDVISKTSSPST